MSDFNHDWLDKPYNKLTDEQLKAVADWHQGWGNKDQHRACVHMMALRTERDELRERVARLVGAIEDAPHGPFCDVRYGGNWKCDCWKSTALEGK